ncbi:thioesterase II family protein [Microbulbifer halophilus]|uniref:Thioesterase II family protein n=2 Tax=Microbulbifer halophilus TaxID=453963 RepID=A0ABW5E790_9GAMM|nr:alpha/beta fold hydrolase [Microbulbifer halophilus]MCW8127255.1 alpha/beta fold hydrolase [Microbulbifer halophilus]
MYQPWRALVDAGVELVPLEYPGRGVRFNHPFATTVDELAEEMARQVRAHGAAHYALFGHSLGALVAFETERRLRAQGRPPARALFVSARRAPDLPVPPRRLHKAPDGELIEFLREQGGTPETALQMPEILELLLPVLRADLHLYEDYHFREESPLECPIHALAGREDSGTPAEAMRAWRPHTRDNFSLTFFDGGHFYLQQQQSALLAYLNSLLTEGWQTAEGETDRATGAPCT